VGPSISVDVLEKK